VATVGAMAGPTPDLVREALRTVLFPNFRRDIVTLGMVGDEIAIDGDRVRVHLRPGTDRPEVRAQLVRAIEAALRRLPGVARVEVEFAGVDEGRGRDPFAARAALPGVKHVVAVASTKGGVGKSTVAANLALALAAGGRRRVGLVDADVYGPSVPIMFGTDARPQVSAEKRIQPVERHGIALMSMGFFLDESSPVIWRGPIVMGIVRQFLRDVDWGERDVLVIDLPPGTGDAPLTLVQQVPVSGGVIVTTPQDVALLDVGRGMAMFAQVSTPVLGVVENMAGYVCPSCGTDDPVFGEGGAERLAARFGVPLLARLPLVPAVREGGDAGRPIVIADPGHPVSRSFGVLAERVAAALEGAPAAEAATPA
ncbi:MAG TPA: Mrp/NBP35 family ATP-binding protein, partial [Candidatus Binatia bacterium]|nr:Mrp/NBP35 family ATP-binding protein [Candidatus Binatia bacterium]